MTQLLSNIFPKFSNSIAVLCLLSLSRAKIIKLIRPEIFKKNNTFNFDNTVDILHTDQIFQVILYVLIKDTEIRFEESFIDFCYIGNWLMNLQNKFVINSK